MAPKNEQGARKGDRGGRRERERASIETDADLVRIRWLSRNARPSPQSLRRRVPASASPSRAASPPAAAPPCTGTPLPPPTRAAAHSPRRRSHAQTSHAHTTPGVNASSPARRKPVAPDEHGADQVTSRECGARRSGPCV
eukprot:1105617-Pleurochrysis_carterae.AAC.5